MRLPKTIFRNSNNNNLDSNQISLSFPKSFAAICLWLPTQELANTPEVNEGVELIPGNFGHVSMLVYNDADNSSKYISLRPLEESALENSPSLLLSSYQEDFYIEKRQHDLVVFLFDLDFSALLEKLGEFQRKLPLWALNVGIPDSQNLGLNDPMNCASFVWTLLLAGKIKASGEPNILGPHNQLIRKKFRCGKIKNNAIVNNFVANTKTIHQLTASVFELELKRNLSNSQAQKTWKAEAKKVWGDYCNPHVFEETYPHQEVISFVIRRNNNNEPAARSVNPSRPRINSIPSLELAFGLFKRACICETEYDNNCAHFLSNALIAAGYNLDEHLQGENRCPKGRLIRAKDLLSWARAKTTHPNFRSNTHSYVKGEERKYNHLGFWFVYQEKTSAPNKGQGHVCLHHHFNAQNGTPEFEWAGTCDFSIDPNWKVNWHYRF